MRLLPQEVHFQYEVFHFQIIPPSFGQPVGPQVAPAHIYSKPYVKLFKIQLKNFNSEPNTKQNKVKKTSNFKAKPKSTVQPMYLTK